eukprot:1400506-Amphidinium_carterae.1
MIGAGPAPSWTRTCFCFLEVDRSASALRGADCLTGSRVGAEGAPIAGRAPMDRERGSGSAPTGCTGVGLGAWVVALGGKFLAGPAGFGFPHLVGCLAVGCCLASAVPSGVSGCPCDAGCVTWPDWTCARVTPCAFTTGMAAVFCWEEALCTVCLGGGVALRGGCTGTGVGVLERALAAGACDCARASCTGPVLCPGTRDATQLAGDVPLSVAGGTCCAR